MCLARRGFLSKNDAHASKYTGSKPPAVRGLV
jgi:hypothetical protein